MSLKDVGWRCFLAIAWCLLLAGTTASQARDHFSKEAVVYQGVSIEPGDVIGLHGGSFVTPLTPTYGHTVLYLGRDHRGQPVFLDFQFRNLYPNQPLGQPEALPQIVGEEEFLVGSRNSQHPSFDVFRLTDRSRLTRDSLIGAANLMASRQWLPLIGKVCSSAVAEVLSQATGQSIDLSTPSCLENPPFHRHPALKGRTINIDVAIAEMRRRVAVERRLAEDRRRREMRATERRVEATKWRTLKTWTDAACMYIAPPLRNGEYAMEATRAQEANNRDLRDLLLNYLVVLPEDRIRALSAADRSLSSCQRQMLALILRAPGPLEATWLVAELDRSKYHVDPLSRFLNNLVRALQDRSAPTVPSGALTRESNAEPRQNHVDRSDRQVGDNLGPAYDQLRGISQRGWHD